MMSGSREMKRNLPDNAHIHTLYAHSRIYTNKYGHILIYLIGLTSQKVKYVTMNNIIGEKIVSFNNVDPTIAS